MGNDFFSPLFILTFFQVALLEETCKFLSFNISEKIRGERQKKDIPVATMFYCGISALGFAFLENIGYAHKFGGSVILLRSLSAMIVHFLCGMIMGYWVSLSRIPSKLDNRSFVEVLFIKKPKVKKWTYSIIGIICASIFHGMFDYNIESGGNPIDNYIIILGGIIAVYIGSKNLNEKYRN
jgi:RsiW-degrading membrane proteinase PrsW (M82 family)